MVGRLIVVSGPSGAGKGTLVREVLQRVPDLCLSISATTRSPRPGEVEGVHYFFLDRREFKRRVDQGGFIEWAEVHGNRYGTPSDWVDAQIGLGKTVILEIDVQGAQQVSAKRPGAHLVFVTAPTVQDLRERMQERGAETAEQIEERLQRAAEELESARTYDYVIMNDDVSRAADELEGIVRRIILEAD